MQWARKQKGFTIVELLIVVVVIAILAATTIVAYNGIQNRTKISAAQVTVRQVRTKLTTHAIENAGQYPAALSAIGVANSGDTTYQYAVNNTAAPATYCVTVTVSTISYYMSHASASPTPGGCAGHGQNGVAAITNLSQNPTARSASVEWFTRYGMNITHVTDAVDGPLPTITSYAHATAATSQTGGGRGVDHLENTDVAVPSSASDRLIWPVTAGESIVISSYARASLTNPVLRHVLRVHSGSGAWVSAVHVCNYVAYSTPGAWVRISCVYTPPISGYLVGSTRFDQSMTWPVGSTLDVTGLMITKGSTVHPYRDGDSPNWVWTGVPYASSSQGPAQ